jgi:hypothetical protein
MKFKFLSLSLFSVLASSSFVFAESEFENLQVLDHPRYTLTNKFILDVGMNFLPLDAYYKPILLEGALSYQFTDLFSVEAIRAGYSLTNYDTGLTKSLEVSAPPGFQVADQDLKHLRFKVGSAAYFNLLYSKSNFFNQSVAYHYWQIGTGVTYFDMNTKSQIGLDLLMRVRFFMTENTTLNIQGGHTIGFKSGVPRNITNLGLGVGFAF